MDRWLSHGDDASFHPPLDDFPPHLHPHLHGALDVQCAIGWGNAVKGLFSSRWRHISTLDMHHASRVDNSQGNLRMRSIIHATHEFPYSNTWLSRNSDLHQRDDAESARIRLSESAEIRHNHSSPQLLAMADRHYCSRLLDCLLMESASTRRRWLHRIKISIAAHERHHNPGNTTCNKYFTCNNFFELRTPDIAVCTCIIIYYNVSFKLCRHKLYYMYDIIVRVQNLLSVQ